MKTTLISKDINKNMSVLNKFGSKVINDSSKERTSLMTVWKEVVNAGVEMESGPN